MLSSKCLPATRPSTRTPTRSAPRRLLPARPATLDAVNVIVGTVAVSLAVDTLSVFLRRHQRREAERAQGGEKDDD